MVIVVASKYALMCNQMVIYSHLMASAKEHGFNMQNYSFAPYFQTFIHPAQDNLTRFPIQKSSYLWPKKIRLLHYRCMYLFVRLLLKLKVDNQFISVLDIGWNTPMDVEAAVFLDKVRSTKYLFIQGWQYHSRTLLLKHANEIRKFFTPKKQVVRNVHQLLAQKQEGALLVGVHIRQGDYKYFEGGKYFYENKIYASKMKEFVALHKNQKVQFIICSNAPKSSEAFQGLDVLDSLGGFAEDLYALSQCDYIMGPPSTFSAWASFYGNVPRLELQSVATSILMEDFSVSLL